MENKSYEITITAFVEATSVAEAEEKYAMGDYYIDYHEITDYNEDGEPVTYNQWSIPNE